MKGSAILKLFKFLAGKAAILKLSKFLAGKAAHSFFTTAQ